MKGEKQIPPGGSLPALLCLWPCQPHLCARPHGGQLIFYIFLLQKRGEFKEREQTYEQKMDLVRRWSNDVKSVIF